MKKKNTIKWCTKSLVATTCKKLLQTSKKKKHFNRKLEDEHMLQKNANDQ